MRASGSAADGAVRLLDEELLALEEAGEEVHEVELGHLLDLEAAVRQRVRDHLAEPLLRALPDQDRVVHAHRPSVRGVPRAPAVLPTGRPRFSRRYAHRSRTRNLRWHKGFSTANRATARRLRAVERVRLPALAENARLVARMRRPAWLA